MPKPQPKKLVKFFSSDGLVGEREFENYHDLPGLVKWHGNFYLYRGWTFSGPPTYVEQTLIDLDAIDAKEKR